MTQHLLIVSIPEKQDNLYNSVIYDHETRTFLIKPSGAFYTEKKLDEYVAKGFPAGEELVFLGYYIYDNEKEAKSKINDLNKIGRCLSLAKITKITKKTTSENEDSKVKDLAYEITATGIGRYILNKADAFLDINAKSTNNLKDVAFADATKSNYANDISSAELNLFGLIDDAVTKLVQNGMWLKIVDYLADNDDSKAMKLVESINNNAKELKNDSPASIISTLMAYAFFDNKDKYTLVCDNKYSSHVKSIVNKIVEFYYIVDWNTKELETFKKIELFKKYEKNRDEYRKKMSPLAKKTKPKNTKKDTLSEAIIEDEINRKVKDNLDKQQKEFLLREKMRAIKESLSENDPESDDEDDEFNKIIKDPVLKNIYPDSVLKVIASEKERVKTMMSGAPDATTALTYINTLKKMPWRKTEIESLDIKKAREVLDKNHYGLKEVKERIIEYLSLIINHKKQAQEAQDNKELIDIDKTHQIDMSLFKKENEENKAQKVYNNVPILTLVGPPGTGKTSLARAIAEALNKSYIKISLGGVHDESEIRGHRRTYVGDMPGKIIKAIERAGVSNPLILLDEIDKMASDYKGDPASAMLEVLDPEQNSKFQDNYLDHEYDLSKVMFIATANYYENIPAPLIDRVEIIELNSYTINEKIKIAREHLIDATIEQAGLKPNQFVISDEVIEYIIKHYTVEAGVRALKRCLDKMARKIVTKIVSGEKINKFVIDQKVAIELLGTPKISDDDNDKEPQVGAVNGLAYTSVGGTTLQIEVSAFPDKSGGIKLTGSLKDVMKESAAIALTYVRANAKKFDIKDFDFENNQIHIHVPEGAVPKDGPSAGVTFTTALISALSNKPVSPTVAMTGEITLRGKVLEIGGLKEKSFAAFKKGVKTVFIPKNNSKDLKDIPDEVKKAIKFVPVERYEQIYEQLFANVKPSKETHTYLSVEEEKPKATKKVAKKPAKK